MTANKRLHVYYTGSVQGVGFRFTAERVAMSFGLTGWARNLSDGRVEITAEGNVRRLNEFLEKIEDVFKAYIKDSDIEWDEASGEFSGFDIRH